MYLSKIELFGFKSFAHRVRISFDKGLTAIVGPNGCGKTNVVDAIRWVLGEQKSALLRSPKMENIIFNGTRNLRPLSLTEVSITIENTRNVLPTEYTEVTVTRRLYRSGDSDYLLNQVPCRLKDILDLFADTGMGSDAYSVIELKMIEEIISNKSEERMKLFEEAAGITRYKQRRKQTFRQLESATRDLARVDDVLAEVEKKVRSLKQQVRKAERFREIRDELKELDLTLAGIAMGSFHEKLQPLVESISDEERQNHELSAKITGLDSVQQESERRQIDLEQKLAEAQRALNDTNARAHALEKQLLQNQEKERSLSSAIERFRISVEEKQRRLEEEQRLSGELALQQGPLDEACSAALEVFNSLKSRQEELNTSLDRTRREQLAERQKAAELQKSLNALNLSRQSLKTRREHLAGSLERIEQRNRELQSLLEQTGPERRNTAAMLASKKERLDELRKEQKRLSTLKSSLVERIEAAKEKLLALRGTHDRLHNQVMLCNSILEKFEGLPEGVAFLEKHRDGKPGLGCLSDLLSLDERYRKAVNAAMGDVLGYYVCRSLDEAKGAVSNLVRADKGKVHFLILDRIDGSRGADASPIDGALKAADAVSFPDTLANAVRILLNECYIVDDLPRAEELAARHPEALFVTMDGQKFRGSGLYFGGSAKGSEGVRLGKKSERDRLQKELKEVAASIAETDAALAAMKREFDAIRVDEARRAAGAVEQEILTLEKKLSRLEAEERSRFAEIGRAAEEASSLRKAAEEAEAEAGRIMPEIERHERESAEFQQKLEAMQRTLSEEETRTRALNADLQLQQGRYRDAQLDREKLAFRVNACRTAAAGLAEEIEKLHAEIKSAEHGRGELATSSRSMREEHEAVLLSSGRQQEELNHLETACRDLKVRNHDALTSLREMRRKHDISQQMVLEFTTRRGRIEQDADHLRTRIMERYGVELDMMPSVVPEGFDEEKARERLEYLQRQRDQFGAINELALEEYESEQGRLDFLVAQKEDLVGAERQLRETIEEINRTALEKFRQTFTEVRKNFIRIFHDLFDPEDEVDLLIHSDDDPLEAHIEIVAKPRGKKPLAIEQLSGGEKALTALSLLFAIYLVKPSPFCILDEVDAPLDDANVTRFIRLLKKFENNTQFIIVTHNKKSMASCQALYGVTMEEEGVSKLIPVKIEKEVGPAEGQA